MKTSSKIILGFFVYTATIMVVLIAIGFWWAANEFQKPGPLQETLLFEVEKGASLFEIADDLRTEGAIENPFIFMFGARVLGAQTELKAGEYEFTPSQSARVIMNKIRKGDVVDRRVTVREGLTSFEVETLLLKVKDLKIILTEPIAEGTLLPGTYDYRKTDTNADLTQRMSQDMTKTIDELWPQRAQNLPFNTPQEAITLASIVEKETGVAEERKRVAGVFINRLKKGVALQSDPTVIYGITKGRPKNEGKGPLGRKLLKKDLEDDTPYNTYLHPGLPPGPIANPGRASIEAVLNPETHDFIYFVADGTGGHVFASSLEEHNKNVARWQKIRREKAKAD